MHRAVEPQSAPGTAAARGAADALARWRAQEEAPLPPLAAADPGGERRLASGWWLLPALVLSLLAWTAIALAIAG